MPHNSKNRKNKSVVVNNGELDKNLVEFTPAIMTIDEDRNEIRENINTTQQKFGLVNTPWFS